MFVPYTRPHYGIITCQNNTVILRVVAGANSKADRFLDFFPPRNGHDGTSAAAVDRISSFTWFTRDKRQREVMTSPYRRNYHITTPRDLML